MERVSFLIEKTGENISCLLNPESLVQRRRTGIETLRGVTGQLTGVGLSDDPVIATGGGTTEYDLDLLFDVDIAQEELVGMGGSNLRGFEGEDGEVLVEPPKTSADDVRTLTRPIWALTENAATSINQRGAPPAVRMIWGRAWNVLGVVVSVAERLERFTSKGVPRRSWLRMRLRRISEAAARPSIREPVTPQYELPPPDAMSESGTTFVEVHSDSDGVPVMRIDLLSAEIIGDSRAWPVIASSNGIDNPLDIEEGTVLAVPVQGRQS